MAKPSHQVMLPHLSPGGLFLFCHLGWQFARKLIGKRKSRQPMMTIQMRARSDAAEYNNFFRAHVH
jgi:hypothetical protein